MIKRLEEEGARPWGHTPGLRTLPQDGIRTLARHRASDRRQARIITVEECPHEKVPDCKRADRLSDAQPGGEAVQTYPTKPVTLVVPYSAGGTADVVARVVGQALSPVLGKAVVVDNRAGGGGVIGWGNVARAAPDGYTLLTAETSLAIAAGLIPKLPFDPRKSFTHVVTAPPCPKFWWSIRRCKPTPFKN